MKIAIVTPFYPNEEVTNAGGIGNHFQHLALGFRDADHEVEVFQFPNICSQDSFFHHNEITVHSFALTPPTWFSTRGLGRLARITGYVDRYRPKYLLRLTHKVFTKLIQKRGFEIIEATSNRGLPLSYLRRERRRLPVLTRVSTTMALHFQENLSKPDFNQRKECEYEEETIHRSDRLVTHTKVHAKELEAELGVDAVRFRIIPHGIDIPAPPEPSVRSINKELKVLFLGRFESRKGADVLLDAIPKVLTNHSTVRFILAGRDEGGTHQRNFLNLHKGEIIKQVEFHGEVSDKKRTELFKDCDVFVAPSRYESFGIVYAEAMSFGKPVIGCDAGGAPEVIGDTAGLLAEVGDPEDLAAKILALCKDEEKRIQMGQNAYKRVSTLFSRKRMVQDTLDLYAEVTNSMGHNCDE